MGRRNARGEEGGFIMWNPAGWACGYLWMIALRVKMRIVPEGGAMWMPNWIQPYWMRCMGFEVRKDILEYLRSGK